MRLLFDLETNGLLPEVTKIHCIVTKDIDSNNVQSWFGSHIEEGIRYLQSAVMLIGHNVCGYDIPVLQKLYPWFETKAVMRDTILISRLIWADMKERDFAHAKTNPAHNKYIGHHSLESWGHRLGVLKGDFAKQNDWSTFTPEMLAYCVQDVEVTHALWKKIEEKNYSEEAIQLEHDFASVIRLQEARGFGFDKAKAIELLTMLSKKRLDIEAQLAAGIKGWWTETKTPEYYELVTDHERARFDLKSQAEKEAKTWKLKKGQNRIETGPMGKKHTPFNPASRDHVARFLTEQYGWKPTEYTAGGKPQIDETVLEELVYPEAKLLNEYFLLEKRISMLSDGTQGWLRVEKDGRIYGRVNTNGAVTGRCTHSQPNIAQVPKVGSPYGKECRSLFIPTKGYKLVGWDASGLELRCLAHYMSPLDNGAFAKELLTGDIHASNQKAAGLPTRDNAKTFIYAYLYGAGDEKIGSIVGGGKQEGRRLKAQFLEKTPALAALKSAVATRVNERGYLLGLDGRQLHIRSAHAALNTLLQSAGAILVKKATVLLHQELLAKGWVFGREWAQVAHIHDEGQAEVKEGLCEEYGSTAVSSIRAAGRHFSFLCGLDGEWHVGGNWGETH